MARLKGWRYSVFIGAFVGAVVTFQYFTAIQPMLNPEPYSKLNICIYYKFFIVA